MARKRPDILTLATVTIVSLFIWLWAAGEVRQQQEISIQLEFIAPNPTEWVVEPQTEWVTVVVEGSSAALRKAGPLSTTPLQLQLGTGNVPGEPGDHILSVRDVLQRNDLFNAAGVAVLRTDPPEIALRLDEIVRVVAEVRVLTPGVLTDGEPVATPTSVTIAMPRRDRMQRFTGDQTVEAVIDRASVGELEPGRRYSRDVRLRLADGMTGPDISVTPSRVNVNFTVRSSLRQTVINVVNVRMAGPWESSAEYGIQLEPAVLRDVEIEAEAEVIRQIEAGEAYVVAVMHLKHSEMESLIDSKRISYFAVISDDDQDGHIVNASRIGEDTTGTMPAIALTITRRDATE